MTIGQAQPATGDAREPAVSTTRVDPITLEVVRHSFVAITEEAAIDLTRTAYSPLIYEYRDFCIALTDQAGTIIAQSHLPRFPGTEVAEAMRVYGRDGIHPGDVYIVNAQEVCGRHLNDVSLLTPAFNAETLVGFVVIRAHWADVGGDGGGYTPTGNRRREIYAEGIQFPLMRLYDRGQLVDDVRRLILQNTRFPVQVEGDMNATLTACVKARKALEALVDKYGWEDVSATIDEVWRQSEQRARNVVRALPDGTYRAETLMDDDGRPNGPPIHVRVGVVVHGDELTFDFSELDPQVAGSMNSGRVGGALMAAKIAFRYIVGPADPINDGTFRAMHLEIPDGTFMSARTGAAMGAYNQPVPTVVDTILKALAPAIPERVAAGHHGSYNLHTFEWTDARTGRRLRHFDTALGGWGGALHHDGFSPTKTLSHGDTRDVPVEFIEALYPLRVERYQFRQDTGGAGAWRGGLGTEKAFVPLEACNLSVGIDRRADPPWGLFGGMDAVPGEVEVVPAPGAEPKVVYKGAMSLEPGAWVAIKTAGGGGYGNPLARTFELVERDVQYGYVSVERALSDYGCVVDPATLTVDVAASRQVRETRGSGPPKT